MEDDLLKLNLYLLLQNLHSKRGRLVLLAEYLKFGKKLVKCYIWNISLYGTETWMLRAVDQKHQESFEMWCRRRMEKINWSDRVRNEEIQGAEEYPTRNTGK